jgi:poly [ADP-ribose] polymerase
MVADKADNTLASHRVYIDDDGTIYDASLNQTNILGNNNKFYRIQLLEPKVRGKFKTWTRWGRVGERGQSKLISGGSFQDAFRDFNKKFKDKTGHTWDDRHEPPKSGKYTFVERSYEQDASSDDDKLPGAGPRLGSKQSTSSGNPPSLLHLPVQQLMQLIFNVRRLLHESAQLIGTTEIL